MNLADGVILLTVAALIAGVIKIMRIQKKNYTKKRILRLFLEIPGD